MVVSAKAALEVGLSKDSGTYVLFEALGPSADLAIVRMPEPEPASTHVQDPNLCCNRSSACAK
jgi:hypothetical protein